MTYNPDHDANLATSVGFAVSLAATMRRFDVLSAILGNTQSLKGNLGVRLAKLHAAIAAGTGHYAQALYDNAFSDAEREIPVVHLMYGLIELGRGHEEEARHIFTGLTTHEDPTVAGHATHLLGLITEPDPWQA